MTAEEPSTGSPPRAAAETRRARTAGYIRGPLGMFIDRSTSVAISVVVNVLVLLMAVVLVWSVVALVFVVAGTIRQQSADEIKDLVIGVLTIFIIIEIFDLFREYLRSGHIKMVNLAEVSLAVVLRELWLLLLDGSENWQLYISLSLVVAAIASFWWVAARHARLGQDGHGRATAPDGGGQATASDGDAVPLTEKR